MTTAKILIGLEKNVDLQHSNSFNYFRSEIVGRDL